MATTVHPPTAARPMLVAFLYWPFVGSHSLKPEDGTSDGAEGGHA